MSVSVKKRTAYDIASLIGANQQAGDTKTELNEASNLNNEHVDIHESTFGKINCQVTCTLEYCIITGR
jgi:hypothetical protein